VGFYDQKWGFENYAPGPPRSVHPKGSGNINNNNQQSFTTYVLLRDGSPRLSSPTIEQRCTSAASSRSAPLKGHAPKHATERASSSSWLEGGSPNLKRHCSVS
jgi:hypothetical protein